MPICPVSRSILIWFSKYAFTLPCFDLFKKASSNWFRVQSTCSRWKLSIISCACTLYLLSKKLYCLRFSFSSFSFLSLTFLRITKHSLSASQYLLSANIFSVKYLRWRSLHIRRRIAYSPFVLGVSFLFTKLIVSVIVFIMKYL